MKRELKDLTNTTFDLLIVGAGIYGTTAAWDAAQRGLSVAIIDRGDFGGATSFNSAKTVHGGVRSLQSGNVSELRLFVRERRTLCRILPHLVHPLPFLIPTYQNLSRNRWLMSMYFTINDCLAYDRNDLSDSSKHLPASHRISREECLELYPWLVAPDLTGALVWYDCQMYNTDRVNLSFLLSATDAGAVAANYVEARAFLRSGKLVVGVSARDIIGGQDFEIRSHLVLNAAGPWAGQLNESLLPGKRNRIVPSLSKAMNLIVRPITKDHAVGGRTKSRFLFIAPWRDCSIIGTSHETHEGGTQSLKVTQTDIERFLKDINTAFPSLNLTLPDVRFVHLGLLPSSSTSHHSLRLLKRSQILDHRIGGISGLLTVLGVRYTTARQTAKQAIDLAFSMLDRDSPPCRTTDIPLTGGAIPNFSDFLNEETSQTIAGLTTETLRRLVLSYGSEYRTILRTIETDRAAANSLSMNCGVTCAEIQHAVRHEMAVKLSDSVLRRTEAGSAGHPGSDVLRRAANVMASELGWTPSQVQAEIDATDNYYKINQE